MFCKMRFMGMKITKNVCPVCPESDGLAITVDKDSILGSFIHKKGKRADGNASAGKRLLMRSPSSMIGSQGSTMFKGSFARSLNYRVFHDWRVTTG